jgi:HAD superfamily hydrolase (TIGR01509 family)
MRHGTTLTLPGAFRAAVFDMDGLLVATEPAWAAAEADLLASHGLVFAETDRLATIGRSIDESVAVYGRRIGLSEEQLAGLRKELLDRLRDHLASAEAQPGARSLVGSLASVMPLGVASASPRIIVDEALAAAHMTGLFGVVVSAEDVVHPKPAPDAYLLACRLLGVDPRDAVAFEDSEPGIRSAVAAGLHCVAIPSDPAIDASRAHLVLPTLEAVIVQAHR